MSETELEASVSLPSGFGVEKVSAHAAAEKTAIWTGQRASSVVQWFAGVMKMERKHRLRVCVEVGVRRCGIPASLRITVGNIADGVTRGLDRPGRAASCPVAIN